MLDINDENLDYNYLYLLSEFNIYNLIFAKDDLKLNNFNVKINNKFNKI